MRTVLIDTSGSISAIGMGETKSLLRVGDHVIMFDTRPYDRGVMDCEAAIRLLNFVGGSGSMLSPTLKLVAKIAPNNPILLLTDGFIGDLRESVEVVEEYILRITDVIDVAGIGDIKRLKKELIL